MGGLAYSLTPVQASNAVLFSMGRDQVKIRRRGSRLFIRPVNDGGCKTSPWKTTRRINIPKTVATDLGLTELVGQRFRLVQTEIEIYRTPKGPVMQKWLELKVHSRTSDPLPLDNTERLVSVGAR